MAVRIDYDVIIIGAGLGSLTAAARLVKAAKRVLVLEKRTHPGGTAYAYGRQGFYFPMGPLGFSHPEIIQDIFFRLGIPTLRLKRVKYTLKAFSLEIPVSVPYNQLSKCLACVAPEDAAALNKFFADMETVNRLRRAGSQIGEGKGLLSTSAKSYLQRNFHDWRLKRLLGSQGTENAYSSFKLLAAMWEMMCRAGIWYPANGFRHFCDSFVTPVTGTAEDKKACRQGIIRYNADVKRILVEKGQACGVLLSDGSQITASWIISNADFKHTFLAMLGSHICPAWQSSILSAPLSGSIVQVCLGIDRHKADLGAFKNADRIIYRRSVKNVRTKADLMSVFTQPQRIASQELEVSLWSKHDPGLAPKGYATVIIRTPAPYGFFLQFMDSSTKGTARYREYKGLIASLLAGEVENLIPGLSRSIVVTDVATPLTFEKLGGRSLGAVAGWSWDYADSPSRDNPELIITPVGHLYMAGHQAFTDLSLGGVPSAILSGNKAAEAVLNDVPPVGDLSWQ